MSFYHCKGRNSVQYMSWSWWHLPYFLSVRQVLVSLKRLTGIMLLLFSRLVMSNSLQPRGPQHSRLACLSLSPQAQTHVHQVGDAIQPSHQLLFPSPPAFNLSQHQESFPMSWLFLSVAKVLELQFQHQSFLFFFLFFRKHFYTKHYKNIL